MDKRIIRFRSVDVPENPFIGKGNFYPDKFLKLMAEIGKFAIMADMISDPTAKQDGMSTMAMINRNCISIFYLYPCVQNFRLPGSRLKKIRT